MWDAQLVALQVYVNNAIVATNYQEAVVQRSIRLVIVPQVYF